MIAHVLVCGVLRFEVCWGPVSTALWSHIDIRSRCAVMLGAPRPRASACGESVSRNDWVPETELIFFQQVLSEPRVEVE